MSRPPPLHRCLCCRHAHLYPAVGFLHQTGQEGVHDVCAKDRGKELVLNTYTDVRE